MDKFTAFIPTGEFRVPEKGELVATVDGIGLVTSYAVTPHVIYRKTEVGPRDTIKLADILGERIPVVEVTTYPKDADGNTNVNHAIVTDRIELLGTTDDSPAVAKLVTDSMGIPDNVRVNDCAFETHPPIAIPAVTVAQMAATVAAGLVTNNKYLEELAAIHVPTPTEDEVKSWETTRFNLAPYVAAEAVNLARAIIRAAHTPE